MRRKKAIVPVPDRRSSRRILTLRNTRNAILVLLLLFVGVNLWSERSGVAPGEYGRLSGRTIPEVPEPVVHAIPVEEQQIADQTAADPTLVAPMTREQWLHEQEQLSAATAQDDLVFEPADEGGSVAIVGDGNGVSIVRSTPRRPVLSGGFGR